MPFYFDDTQSDHMLAAEAPLGSSPDRPWMATAWVAPLTVAASSRQIAVIGQSAANQYEGLGAFGDDVYALSRDGSANAPANTPGTGLATSTWALAAARFDSATSRSAYVNTTQGTVVTTSVSPTGFDRVTIGCRPTITEFWNGVIGYVCFWTLDGMSEGDIDQLVADLAGGEHPLALTTAAGLVRFWLPNESDTLDDLSGNGGATLTNNGALYISDDVQWPPVDPPPSPPSGGSYLNLALLGVG